MALTLGASSASERSAHWPVKSVTGRDIGDDFCSGNFAKRNGEVKRDSKMEKQMAQKNFQYFGRVRKLFVKKNNSFVTAILA
jgi:hypothetical protein